eukprot:m.12579 g.12579  ORF g.12579 m.12579 type:complete len:608 (-) comp4673_c0_seq2:170-1993(-)
MRSFARALCVFVACAHVHSSTVEEDADGNLVLVSSALKEVHVKAEGEDPQSLTKTMDDVNMLTEDIYGRSRRASGGGGGGRPLTETSEDMLTELKSVGTQLNGLQTSVDACEKQGASVSMIQNCGVFGDCTFENADATGMFIIGRNFLSGVGVYSAEYVIARTIVGGTAPVSQTTMCDYQEDSKSGLHCALPSFPQEQVFAAKMEVFVTIKEGMLTITGGRSLKITLTAGGPTISFVPDQVFITHSKLLGYKTRVVPVTVTDPDTAMENLNFTGLSSDESVAKVTFTGDKATIKVSKYGEANMTLQVRDNHGIVGQHTFKIVYRNYFQSCKEAMEMVPEFTSSAITISFNGQQVADVYCEIYGGVPFTMCGKFREGKEKGLQFPWGRRFINVPGLENPFEFHSSADQGASLDCRELIKDGATHMLSACYMNGDNNPLMARVTTIPKEVLADPTNLFDVTKDVLTIKKEQNIGKIHTWWYDEHRQEFRDTEGTDCEGQPKCANLGTYSGFDTDTGWTVFDREGALYSNAGNAAGTGTTDDTVFWGFRGMSKKGETERLWKYPEYGNQGNRGIGGIVIGTSSNRAVNGEYDRPCDVSVMYFGAPDLPIY